MPVQMNILENEVLGREYNRGTHEGKVTALGPLLENVSAQLAKTS